MQMKTLEQQMRDMSALFEASNVSAAAAPVQSSAVTSAAAEDPRSSNALWSADAQTRVRMTAADGSSSETAEAAPASPQQTLLSQDSALSKAQLSQADVSQTSAAASALQSTNASTQASRSDDVPGD
jgi:hypothetical protein